MSNVKPVVEQVTIPCPQVQRPDMVTDTESELHGFEQTQTECVWHLGSPCFGLNFMANLFNGQLNVPMCQHHMDGHRVIMTIANNMTDTQRKVAIERVLVMTEDERLTIVRNRNYKLVPWSEV